MLSRPAVVLDRCTPACHGVAPKEARVLLVRRRVLAPKYLVWCFGCNLRARFYGTGIATAIETATAAAHDHVCRPPKPAAVVWPGDVPRSDRRPAR